LICSDVSTVSIDKLPWSDGGYFRSRKSYGSFDAHSVVFLPFPRSIGNWRLDELRKHFRSGRENGNPIRPTARYSKIDQNYYRRTVERLEGIDILVKQVKDGPDERDQKSVRLASHQGDREYRNREIDNAKVSLCDQLFVALGKPSPGRYLHTCADSTALRCYRCSEEMSTRTSLPLANSAPPSSRQGETIWMWGRYPISCICGRRALVALLTCLTSLSNFIRSRT
jgi:hypothetical protein